MRAQISRPTRKKAQQRSKQAQQRSRPLQQRHARSRHGDTRAAGKTRGQAATGADRGRSAADRGRSAADRGRSAASARRPSRRLHPHPPGPPKGLSSHGHPQCPDSAPSVTHSRTAHETPPTRRPAHAPTRRAIGAPVRASARACRQARHLDGVGGGGVPAHGLAVHHPQPVVVHLLLRPGPAGHVPCEPRPVILGVRSLPAPPVVT